MAAASAADKRRLLADLASSRRRGDRPSWLGRAAFALGVAAVVLLLILWFAGWFSAPGPVREFRGVVADQMTVLGRVARNEVPLAEASFAPVFEQLRHVPREQREQVRGEIERLYAARETAEIDSFFRLPPPARQAELDRRIRAEDDRRRAWEARRAAADSRGPAGGGSATAAGSRGGGTAAGGGSGPPARRSSTEEARNQRYKAAIDRTTPEQRARRAEYRRIMDERRRQLGGSGVRR